MARLPRCKICGEFVYKDTEEWVKNSVGYYHTKCKESKEIAKPKKVEPKSEETEQKTVKCYLCGLQCDKAAAVREDGKIFHPECHPEYLDRKELFRYCCNLWGLKAPGPLIARQSKEFRKKGYTYRGMMFALKYFYEVKNNDRNKYKGSETIGIVPYCYEDAKAYYTNIIQKKQELAAAAKSVENKEKQVIKYVPVKKLPKLYDFE